MIIIIYFALIVYLQNWERKKKHSIIGPTKGIAELYGIPVHHTPENAKTLNGWKVKYIYAYKEK